MFKAALFGLALLFGADAVKLHHQAGIKYQIKILMLLSYQMFSSKQKIL